MFPRKKVRISVPLSQHLVTRPLPVSPGQTTRNYLCALCTSKHGRCAGCPQYDRLLVSVLPDVFFWGAQNSWGAVFAGTGVLVFGRLAFAATDNLVVLKVGWLHCELLTQV